MALIISRLCASKFNGTPSYQLIDKMTLYVPVQREVRTERRRISTGMTDYRKGGGGGALVNGAEVCVVLTEVCSAAGGGG